MPARHVVTAALSQRSALFRVLLSLLAVWLGLSTLVYLVERHAVMPVWGQAAAAAIVALTTLAVRPLWRVPAWAARWLPWQAALLVVLSGIVVASQLSVTASSPEASVAIVFQFPAALVYGLLALISRKTIEWAARAHF